MTRVSPRLRRLLLIINIFFATAGGLAVVVSLALLSPSPEGSREVEVPTTGHIVLYVVGSVTVVVAILGVYGAQKENLLALTVFLVCMVVGGLLMLRAGVPAAAARPQVKAPPALYSGFHVGESDGGKVAFTSTPGPGFRRHQEVGRRSAGITALLRPVQLQGLGGQRPRLLPVQPGRGDGEVSDRQLQTLLSPHHGVLGLVLSSLMIYQMINAADGPSAPLSVPVTFSNQPPAYHQLRNLPEGHGSQHRFRFTTAARGAGWPGPHRCSDPRVPIGPAAEGGGSPNRLVGHLLGRRAAGGVASTSRGTAGRRAGLRKTADCQFDPLFVSAYDSLARMYGKSEKPGRSFPGFKPTRKTERIVAAVFSPGNMSGVNTTLKRVFTIFNIIFAIVGGVIITLTLLSQVLSSDNGGENLKGRTTALVVFNIIGFAILIIATLGAYGAHKESKVSLIIFLVCMAIGGVLMLRAGVSAVVVRPQLKGTLDEEFRSLLPLDKAPGEVQKIVKNLQMQLRCCGMFSYTDWEDNIPDSCLCGPVEEEEDKCQIVNYRSFMQTRVYTKTCAPILTSYFLLVADIVIGIVFTLAVLALLGLILSCTMIRQMRNPARPTVLMDISTIFTAPPPKYQELHNPPSY
ncbi:uncharacterized protein LOC120803773 [Xiphias gladius]|uniref:uncharacterized protein LOC120803773 n=1 Tax=Xiphias gladius TaxID=8245 RepID=UPI001A99F935|nr:uncharacterized protein LOC120803773 [Xiphias gladius]